MAVPTPNGQKTTRPAARSIAGANVILAANATTRHMAIAGPLLLNLPKSAKNIIPRPKIVVNALAAKALPTWPNARAIASA